MGCCQRWYFNERWFWRQALFIHPEKEIVIAYFNHIDQDWGIIIMLSTRAINAIINAVEKSR